MQTAPGNHAMLPWGVALILAGLVLPLSFGTIAGASGVALGRESNGGNESAALTAILACRGVPIGQLSPDCSVTVARPHPERDVSHQIAVAFVGPNVGATPGKDAPSSGATDEASRSIEALLGQLNTRDESTLREALSGMSDAGRVHLSLLDPETGQLVSSWAEEFSTRLAAATIPAGARERLTAELASWEHGIGTSIDVSRNDPHRTANVSFSVAATSENADTALRTGRDQDTRPFQAPWWITWFLLGIPVAVGVLLASSAGIRSQRPRNVPKHAPKASASLLHGLGSAI